MIEAAKNIYCFPVPLPKNPLKELNCYIIKGDGRHLMVDAGFNTDEGHAAVNHAFSELGISLKDTDIFLTHLHADHTGLIERLKADCGDIYISETDGGYVNKAFMDSYWTSRTERQRLMGFPENEILDYKQHPMYKYGAKTHTDFQFVSPGKAFSYSGYNFTAIDLKGHTPGQLGLYDKEKGVLFCGDHVLNKITPNIQLWEFETDSLGCFLENLKKVRQLDIKLLLSAHRSFIKNHAGRIDELLLHHERRLANILSLLKNGKTIPYEIASGILWEFGDGVFEAFPPAQKMFASSEVLAHLEHLRRLGEVSLVSTDPVYVYQAARA